MVDGTAYFLHRSALAIAVVAIVTGWLEVTPAHSQPAGETTVLRAQRILDGRGGLIEDTDLVIRDGRIAEIVPRGSGRGDRVYDLTALTVLPGYIDTHVHIGAHFDEHGKLHAPAADPDIGHLTLYGAENAYRTLMNGITTMQSLGSPQDAELKAWIDRSEIPGPRLLTSLGAVNEDTGTPEQIRAYVRERAAAGADVIKVFAIPAPALHRRAATGPHTGWSCRRCRNRDPHTSPLQAPAPAATRAEARKRSSA